MRKVRPLALAASSIGRAPAGALLHIGFCMFTMPAEPEHLDHTVGVQRGRQQHLRRIDPDAA